MAGPNPWNAGPGELSIDTEYGGWQCGKCLRWNPDDEQDCGECGPGPCGWCGDAVCSCDAADEIGDDGRPL